MKTVLLHTVEKKKANRDLQDPVVKSDTGVQYIFKSISSINCFTKNVVNEYRNFHVILFRVVGILKKLT